MLNKMKYFNTPHERKSAVLTSIIAAILLLLLSFVGLKYFDPPISFGMEVNFGTSALGRGKVQPTQPVASQPKSTPQQTKPVPVQPKVEKAVTKVLTQEETSIPVVKKQPKKLLPKAAPPKKETPKKRKRKPHPPHLSPL